jgi:hypothetical protein
MPSSRVIREYHVRSDGIPKLASHALNATVGGCPTRRANHMDVWAGRKVLSIEGLRENLRVARYIPGDWEEELETLAAQSPSKR